MSNLRAEIREKIAKAVGIEASALEEPEEEGYGDFAFPCFTLAKAEKKNPKEVAESIAKKVKIEGVSAKALGPFLNFYIDWPTFGQKLLAEIGEDYGRGKGRGKALVEHTSINPNASPHMGRARNAIIGDSIVRMLKFLGYDVETHYFVNDMGKQIALLVWGCLDQDFDFSKLLSIYVEANEKMENDPAVEKEILEMLAKFEAGDRTVRNRFKDVVGTCIEGQKKILEELNVHYDHFDYESKLLSKTEEVLQGLEKTGKLITDEQGRKVLPYKDTFFVIARGDGTSLYGLRDIAYTIEKANKAKGMNILVLGEDQKLYFEQLSYAMKLLGIEPPKVVHYSFVLLPSGKMSTRKGEVVLLDDFLHEAFEKAKEEVKNRYSDLGEKEIEKRAKAIAVAAVRYNMVKVGPDKNVIFSLEDALRFEGDTGPYIQYTHARACSILEKAGKIPKKSLKAFGDVRELEVLKKLSRFPAVVEKASADLKPHIVAVYLHELADLFNEFYQNVNVLKAEEGERAARLRLVEATKNVIKNGLEILGIDAPEKM